MDKLVPVPSIIRLCSVYSVLEELENNNIFYASSCVLGKRLSVNQHSIRKDINYLGEIGPSRAGYPVARLKGLIKNKFLFNQERRTGIIGLSGLGYSLLQNDFLSNHGFKIEAGFDSSLNKIEIIKTDIPLFPISELQDIIERKNISLIIITPLSSDISGIMEKLEKTGIIGIVNFHPQFLVSKKKNIRIRNINILEECRIISALAGIDIKETGENNEEGV